MTPKELPSIDEIRKHLSVDENGNLFRNGKPLKTKPHKDGYTYVSINGERYTAHRISYSLQVDRCLKPDEIIDHVNGDKQNNSLFNLRVVSQKINMKNQKRRNTNKSGVTGVRWDKDIKKWRSMIVVNYKATHLGYFEDFGEAVAVRKAAEAKNGFHINHGRKDGHAS